MSEPERLELTVCGQRLVLRVEPAEVDRLKRAAGHVAAKVESFKESGATAASLRLAILAALDIAHELLRERDGVGDSASAKAAAAAKAEAAAIAAKKQEEAHRLDELIERVDKALGGATLEDTKQRG